MSAALIFEASERYPFRVEHGNDHKAWAKRIMYREEHGDKTLLPIQVTFARQALGVQAEVA